MNKRPNIESSHIDPVLKDLAPLVGEWHMVGTHPMFSSAASGHSSFKWLEHGALLVWHFAWEQPGPPSAICVVGHDDLAKNYSMLYSDERGVARIYQMSLEGQVWKMWRESPNFWQRLTGAFSEDGNTITSHGESSGDGVHWEQDLDVIYTRER